MPVRKTTEAFIIESRMVHGSKYDYSRVVYKNNSSKIEIGCPSHGYYFAIAKRHSHHEQGCPICGIGALNHKNHSLNNRKTQEQFLLDAERVHGDKFDYSLCRYEGGKKKMPIICRTHGIFYQHSENHINAGTGCLKCYRESRIGKKAVSGYCAAYFASYPERRGIPALVYVARMQHLNDDFIKIGITTKNSVKQRFYYHAKHGTVITPLIEKQETLYDAFVVETEILLALASHRYYPNRKFAGYTECVKINAESLSLLSGYFGINIQELIVN